MKNYRRTALILLIALLMASCGAENPSENPAETTGAEAVVPETEVQQETEG